MTNQFNGKIKRLEIENFTCFSKATFDFSPDINVFIGENGTGKTHLLKVLYSGLLSLDDKIDKHPEQHINGVIGNRYHVLLKDNFNIRDFEKLRRRNNVPLKVAIESGEDLKFGINTHFVIDGSLPSERFHVLYIPPQEMLSWHKGFSSLYVNREVSFDKTYFDLSVALGLQPLRNSALEKAEELVKQLEQTINVKVSKKDDRFYIRFLKEKTEHEATVVAHGINKIAQLIYLINNGSLTNDTILFWDEPEANLNPKYITLITKFIQTLANAGVQVFVASHDYLLVHELSLLSEYKEEIKMEEQKVANVKFFGLYKGENGDTIIEQGNSMADLQNDAIIREFIAHDNREEALFRKSHTNILL